MTTLAKMTIKGTEEIELMLSELGSRSIEIGKRAVREAANIVADKVRSNIENLPEDTFRRLTEGDRFGVVTGSQKKDLLDNMGITPVSVSDDGYINVKVGFHGYGSHRTKKYPKGLPNQLLARAIESGSSVRNKTPFIRPAINKTQDEAIDKMQEVINEEIENM